MLLLVPASQGVRRLAKCAGRALVALYSHAGSFRGRNRTPCVFMCGDIESVTTFIDLVLLRVFCSLLSACVWRSRLPLRYSLVSCRWVRSILPVLPLRFHYVRFSSYITAYYGSLLARVPKSYTPVDLYLRLLPREPHSVPIEFTNCAG